MAQIESHLESKNLNSTKEFSKSCGRYQEKKIRESDEYAPVIVLGQTWQTVIFLLGGWGGGGWLMPTHTRVLSGGNVCELVGIQMQS